MQLQRRVFWYTVGMKHSETPSPASSFIGHVKNGVVVVKKAGKWLPSVMPVAKPHWDLLCRMGGWRA